MNLFTMRIFVLMVLSFCFVRASAGDTTDLLLRRQAYLSPFPAFREMAGSNPALQYDRYDYSLTEIGLNGNYEDEKRPLLLQEGDSRKGFGFQARSRIRLNPRARAWGEAFYRNERKRNVQWNETSDFRLLYPYVMADTTGGNLKSETYYFAGGYAREHGKLTWGTTLDFRAMQEYRNKDPRPRNLVTDLNVTAGAAWQVSRQYRAGLSGQVRKYKQTNDVSFLGTAGSSTVYHLTGLGMDYVRFAGNNMSTYYKGTGGGGSVDLYPRNGEGWSVSLLYNSFSFQKNMTDLNKLPLVKAVEQTLGGEVAWTTRKPEYQLGIKGTGENRKRKGTENLFGDPAGNIYPQIGQAELYENKVMQGNASVLYERTSRPHFRWSILPEAGYRETTTRYHSPERSCRLSEMNTSLRLSSTYRLKNGLLHFTARNSYHKNLEAGKTWDDLAADEPVRGMMEQNFRTLASDRNQLDLSARCDYSGRLKNKVLFAETRWQYAWIAGSRNGGGVFFAAGIVL